MTFNEKYSGPLSSTHLFQDVGKIPTVLQKTEIRSVTDVLSFDS